jgi:acetyl esterase/lipase
MVKRRASALLAAAAVLGGTLAACSSGKSTSAGAASSATSQTSSACPSSSPGGPGGIPSGAGGAGTGTGAPGPGAGGGVSIPMAKTIASSDTSTSTVIDGSGAQIQCGKMQLTSYSDILYDTPTSAGKQVPLKLDLQVPKTSGKKPLVVYITGGGFVSAAKAGNLDQRTYVAEQGYVVASIEYRTVTSGATYKDSVADVKSAIRYLRAHAAQYGIDPNEVAVWGQSAGGYLAAMTGVTNGLAQFEDGGNPGQSSTVQAVVDEFGPSDIAKVAADYDVAAQQANYVAGNSLAQFVIGIGTKLSVTADPAADAAASPLTYVTASSPPFVLLHGSADQLVSPSQTLILHNALRARGVDSTRYVVKGANHGDLSFMGGDPNAAKQWSSQQVMGDIVSFLGKHLGG